MQSVETTPLIVLAIKKVVQFGITITSFLIGLETLSWHSSLFCYYCDEILTTAILGEEGFISLPFQITIDDRGKLRQ